MLNLTRFPTESIQIGENITITILGISGNQVRLGIDAPKDVLVLREEVAARMAASRSSHATDAGPARRQHTLSQEARAKAESPSSDLSSSPREPKVRYKRRVRIPMHNKA